MLTFASTGTLDFDHMFHLTRFYVVDFLRPLTNSRPRGHSRIGQCGFYWPVEAVFRIARYEINIGHVVDVVISIE